jgi:hypothetical protein
MNGEDSRITFFQQLLDLSHLDPGLDPVPLVERALALLLEATSIDHVLLELQSEPSFRRGAARGRPLDPETFANPFVRRLINAVIVERQPVVTTTARTTILCIPIPAPVDLKLRNSTPARGIGAIYAQTHGPAGEGDRACLEALAREVRHHGLAITAGKPASLEDETVRFRNQRIAVAIQRAKGNVAAAARALGVPRPNLYDWVKDLRSRSGRTGRRVKSVDTPTLHRVSKR